MIPNKIKEKITFVLNSKFGGNTSILDVQIISGGCVNNSCKIISSCGEFFLKWNLCCTEKMFETEVKGLKILEESGSLCVPEVIFFEQNFFFCFKTIKRVQPFFTTIL